MLSLSVLTNEEESRANTKNNENNKQKLPLFTERSLLFSLSKERENDNAQRRESFITLKTFFPTNETERKNCLGFETP
jgi:hypothetical protein